MKAFVVFVSGALLAVPALAQPMSGGTTGTHQPRRQREPGCAQRNAANDGEDSERRICRRIDRPANRTGARRVCRTAAQWRNAQRSN